MSAHARINRTACQFWNTGTIAARSHSTLARRILIGGQVALSVVLLVAGGLFLKVFVRAQRAVLGFNPDHMLLVFMDLGLHGYKDTQATHLNQQIRERVAEADWQKQAITRNIKRRPLLR